MLDCQLFVIFFIFSVWLHSGLMLSTTTNPENVHPSVDTASAAPANAQAAPAAPEASLVASSSSRDIGTSKRPADTKPISSSDAKRRRLSKTFLATVPDYESGQYVKNITVEFDGVKTKVSLASTKDGMVGILLFPENVCAPWALDEYGCTKGAKSHVQKGKNYTVRFHAAHGSIIDLDSTPGNGAIVLGKCHPRLQSLINSAVSRSSPYIQEALKGLKSPEFRKLQKEQAEYEAKMKEAHELRDLQLQVAQARREASMTLVPVEEKAEEEEDCQIVEGPSFSGAFPLQAAAPAPSQPHLVGSQIGFSMVPATALPRLSDVMNQDSLLHYDSVHGCLGSYFNPDPSMLRRLKFSAFITHGLNKKICDNRACTKMPDPSGHVVCTLCLSAIFCSSECMEGTCHPGQDIGCYPHPGWSWSY